MEVLEPVGHGTERDWRIIIPSRVLGAISQLTGREQESVQALIEGLRQEGIRVLSDRVSVTKIGDAGNVFFVRLPDAPDVRLFVRLVDETTMEVEDIVRPQTLRNLFHAHAS